MLSSMALGVANANRYIQASMLFACRLSVAVAPLPPCPLPLYNTTAFPSRDNFHQSKMDDNSEAS